MKTVLSIPGIHCDSCVAMIKDVSGDHPAIEKIDVDLATKQVTIEHGEDLDLHKWIEDVEALSDQYTVHRVS